MVIKVHNHFYHVGASESLRNEMKEALVIRPGFATPDTEEQSTEKLAGSQQLSFELSDPPSSS
jgi:hypothetical protein